MLEELFNKGLEKSDLRITEDEDELRIKPKHLEKFDTPSLWSAVKDSADIVTTIDSQTISPPLLECQVKS